MDIREIARRAKVSTATVIDPKGMESSVRRLIERHVEHSISGWDMHYHGLDNGAC